MSHNYKKIPAIYKRDPHINIISIGEFSSPYLEILKDIPWIGTEKIDGSNVCLSWNGDRVEMKGHTHASQFNDSQMKFFQEHFLTSEFEELMEQNFGEKHVNIYMEIFGGDIGRYAKMYSPDIHVRIFDVGFPSEENMEIFSRQEIVENISMELGMKYAPVMIHGTLEEMVRFVKSKPLSPTAMELGRNDTVIEGIVARPSIGLRGQMGERIITKIKVKDFC